MAGESAWLSSRSADQSIVSWCQHQLGDGAGFDGGDLGLRADLDDDADGQKDCADLDCTDRACSTGNACIEGQTCSNGTCQGGRQVQCSTPPSGCF